MANNGLMTVQDGHRILFSTGSTSPDIWIVPQKMTIRGILQINGSGSICVDDDLQLKWGTGFDWTSAYDSANDWLEFLGAAGAAESAAPGLQTIGGAGGAAAGAAVGGKGATFTYTAGAGGAGDGSFAGGAGGDITINPGAAGADGGGGAGTAGVVDIAVTSGSQVTIGANLDATAGADITGGDFTHASGGTGNIDVSWDFSAGVTNSAGEMLISGGNLQLNDDRVLSFGTGDDASLSYVSVSDTVFFATADGGPTKLGIKTGDQTGAATPSQALTITTGSSALGNSADLTIGPGTSATQTGGDMVISSGAGDTSGSVLIGTPVAGTTDGGINFTIGGNAVGQWSFAGTTAKLNIGAASLELTHDGTDGFITEDAGHLTISASVASKELRFSDGFKAGSGFGTSLTLSDSSAEWDAFETAFGEASLLGAIEQASTGGTAAFVSFSETADVALLALQIVAADDVNASGNIAVADHNTTGGPFNRAIGVAAAAASAGASVEVYLTGRITVPAAQWDGAVQPAVTSIGSAVYGSVTTAGEYTVVAPTASGDTVQTIGTYLGSGKVALNLGDPLEIV